MTKKRSLPNDSDPEVPPTPSKKPKTDHFDEFLFIKNLPPLVPRNRRPVLPPSSTTPGGKGGRITLALDLDGTLVYTSRDRFRNSFPIERGGGDGGWHGKLRPYLAQFLQRVSTKFEVILFTAAKKGYADSIVDLMDPKRKLIKYRLYRKNCIRIEGNYVKDLSTLGRDLSRVILVDDTMYSFGYQLDNGIPIRSWKGEESDEELLKLLPFLEELAEKNQDVRPQLREKYQLRSKLPPD